MQIFSIYAENRNITPGELVDKLKSSNVIIPEVEAEERLQGIQPQFAAAPRKKTKKKKKKKKKTTKVERTARQLAREMFDKLVLKQKAKADSLEERRDAL